MLVCVWVDMKWPQHNPKQFRMVVKLSVTKKVPNTEKLPLEGIQGSAVVWQVTHVLRYGCCFPSRFKFVAIWPKPRWTSGCTHWPVLDLYHYPLQWVCKMVLSLHTLAGMVFTEKMARAFLARALEKWKRAHFKNKKKMQPKRQYMIKTYSFFCCGSSFLFFPWGRMGEHWRGCKSMAAVPQKREITQKVLNHTGANLAREHLLA